MNTGGRDHHGESCSISSAFPSPLSRPLSGTLLLLQYGILYVQLRDIQYYTERLSQLKTEKVVCVLDHTAELLISHVKRPR